MQSPRVSGNNVLLSAVACVLVALVGGGVCCCCYMLGKEHKSKHGVKIDVEYGKFEKPPETP
ncbi:MAG: hypothetical protein ACTHK7_08175 [Aureliella sp.]